MATFIDESGDIGVKDGSSDCFRLAAVWFESETEIDTYENSVCSLLNRLGLSSEFKFHFTENSDFIRLAFFEMIQPLAFNFAAHSVTKTNLPNPQLSKIGIREATINGLAEQLEPWYHIAEGCREGVTGLNERIIFDNCDDRRYANLLKFTFKRLTSKRGPNAKLVRSVKPGKAEIDRRLQLADMICGAFGRYLDGDRRFFRFIETKMLSTEVARL